MAGCSTDTDSWGFGFLKDDDNDGWWDHMSKSVVQTHSCGPRPNDLDKTESGHIEKDTDEDGWSDLDEILCGSSP
ncbi:MAG: hypothetical protein Ct9H90mP14_3540 [Methanobacteriota archaeon]|nr:MAG: hypothetical protein Ct9H90mP14_3540 [Euryarchaeota archaeon]